MNLFLFHLHMFNIMLKNIVEVSSIQNSEKNCNFSTFYILGLNFVVNMKPSVSHQRKKLDTKPNIPYNIKISNKIDATDQKRGQIEVKPGYHLIGKSDF